MKTDVDTCLIELADWFVKNKRDMTESEFTPILLKHCGSEAEVEKFVKFLETEAGQVRFALQLRERKEGPPKPSTLKEPTKERAGRCYELAWRHITEQNEGTLIHGQVWSSKLGRMIDHAWVETETGYIYEPESDSYHPKDWLYKTYKVKEFNTYTPDQARIMAIRTNKYGPWTEPERKAFLKASPSYLKEEVPETECQIVSPANYDLIKWVGIPAPDYSLQFEPEARERKIDDVLSKLRAGVDSLQSSEKFREFLLTMSKFHDYSIGNQILIMIQRRDATHVAGFSKWKELSRYVKGGERGIAILAPCLPPKQVRVGEELYRCKKCRRVFPASKQVEVWTDGLSRRCPYCQGETEVAEEAGLQPLYFKVVYVFDISQTEGKPLPEFEVPVLTGAANEELFSKLMALTKTQGLEVSFEPKPDQPPEIKGMYSGKSIWVRPEEARAQQLKTLLHEDAHYLAEGVFRIPRADAEVIAESAAFTVGAHFGFDTGTRSFPYIVLWSKDKKVLEANLGAIRKVSDRMITGLEG